MSRREDPTIVAMRAANPVLAAKIRATLDDRELDDRLRAAIAAGEAPAPPERRLRSRRRLGLAAALACAALAILAIALTDLDGRAGRPEFAAAAVEVAETNPRLLVAAPGWRVVDANEFEPDYGEMIFGDGRRRLTLAWYPAELYREYLRDRAGVSRPRRSTLLGREATTVAYGHREYATMLAPQGEVFLELRGRLGSRAAYEELLDTLQPVGVEDWLEAMPADVVRPDARPAKVDELLRKVPLPPGFDLSALQTDQAVANRYQVAVDVAGAVACGWVESWLRARSRDDTEAMDAAATAIGSFRSWPLTEVLTEGGGFSDNLEMTARQLRAGRLNEGAAGTVVEPDGSGYDLGPAWAVALGCDSRIRKSEPEG
ncbi:MAG: hypothetical protein R2725_09930 [Solirubrobacterales bacterium]